MRKRYLCVMFAGCLVAMTPAVAEKAAEGDKWWPSEWGPEDQRGAANRLTPRKVMEAAGLIRKGKTYQLGRVYEPGIPLFGNRHYSLTIPGSPTGGPVGENQLIWYDEMFSGEIGQVGTQFDGLGHIGTRKGDQDIFYNGFTRSEVGTAYGLEKLGIENVGVIFTRGVLVDVAKYKGLERLDVGYVISAADIEGALKKQAVSVTEGDIVLIRTGHGKLWMVDNETYNSGQPGIGLEAARWLLEMKIVMVGADTWAVEAVPGEDSEGAFRVHELLIQRNGVYILENLDLDGLAADGVYEFAFVFAPLRLKGATGSPGNPFAIR
ncbi:MAG: cyclase family protein [Gemmatimonadetes bacterium]|nr:cyclase family protein [Gemmatimonadota bacterium]MDE3258537.1 cyclase family protein [Gemmatimonadota bacterium]